MEPRAIPGRPPRKGTVLKEWLPHHLEANDDLTLEEHTARLSRRSSGRRSPPPPPLGGLSLACPMDPGRSKKVAEIASERDEEARGLWRWLASHYFDARRLVFVDESGFHTSMTTRLRARAPRGKRAYGKVPIGTAARTLP